MEKKVNSKQDGVLNDFFHDHCPPQILKEREKQVGTDNSSVSVPVGGKKSLAGSVSQRACVFCGSRVVLYPITDAAHIVHGPIGCASYTWDIRGSVSSGPQLHRNSFSTDLKETDVIFGGEKKLKVVIDEIVELYKPKAVFVYSTCIVGLIGDDVAAVCFAAERKYHIPVIPVHSEGFKGTKKDGYRAACDALFTLIEKPEEKEDLTINILGEFNLAGEAWILKKYYEQIGIKVLATLTGDGRIDEIRKCARAKLNVVQCSGSMTYLAKQMQEKFDVAQMHVSYFGIEDLTEALYKVADFFPDHPELKIKAAELVRSELGLLLPALAKYRKDLEGRHAAIYVGGAFKSISLVKALRHLGMKTVLVGSQTGNKDDYETLRRICEPDTVIVDDSNPAELSRFLIEKDADIFIGGVKERPLAYKIGIGFVDHNHERKIPLAGFEGMLNFAKEVHGTVMSPVWRHVKEFRMKGGQL